MRIRFGLEISLKTTIVPGEVTVLSQKFVTSVIGWVYDFTLKETLDYAKVDLKLLVVDTRGERSSYGCNGF